MRLIIALLMLVGSAATAVGGFPPGFRWGAAVAGFQVDMGGALATRDANTDWWAWAHDATNIATGRVSGDLPEDGPAEYERFAEDARLVQRRLHGNTFRLSLEWSRLFPVSTAVVDASGGVTPAVLAALDVLADPGAVAHYRAVLTTLRGRGLEPFVTLNHFSLPLWIHDPIAARAALSGIDPSGPLPTGFGPAGWLDATTVTEFAKYAAWVGWKFGDLVDLWSPLNEPLVVATSGYVNIPGAFAGNFPPGAFTFTGAITVILNEAAAQAAGYDALKGEDVVDSDGDGTAAVVGVVHNMAAFHPANSLAAIDIAGAAHADYLFNRLYLNAVVHGDADVNANGVVDPGEHQTALAGRTDFIGVNYYLRATAQGLGVPVTPVIPLLDFLPVVGYRTARNPTGPQCPSICTDFGWEIYPAGLGEVLATAGSYGLPVYITENGIADADDDQRPGYLVQHLAVLEDAIRDGVADVRGYYHWSLVDNFEWSSGYYPRFGLFSFDATHRRHARRSVRTFARIARRNTVLPRLRARFGA